MSAFPGIEVAAATRDQVGESPVWSPGAGALHWVDIEGRCVRRLDWASRAVSSWQLPQRVGCIAPRAAGGLVAGLEDGVYALALPPQEADAAPTLRAAVAHPRPDMRFNDGRCDRAGRFWASTMVRDMGLGSPLGSLYRYDARGLSAPLVTGLVTGNGLAFSPDNRILYLSDSHPDVRRIWRWTLDDDGTPLDRREFVDMRQHPGRPDGAAIDAEGCYWTCANDAGVLHRFTPDGRLDRSIRLPVSKPAMCAFGGPGLDWLFVTSIRPARPVDGFDAALDGALLALRPGVTGLPETPCLD
ncbi:MAG TPA: SMP-30/gluconolactonase/LRE family protein [Ramlibacter sp.]|jgi:sugar lactone lactonase YvrE|uniref:SMP-30/gluconolactonase/LRE family protein n=1 Tax=Ramlibacter sp. TaxID=1917967 RepID=UPI002D57D3A9|nr:SMP-30/gluconolactonase/LRE family protein [Ramlibacter sp.]HZY18106.1 SMP-30/gluconolactonase/LRE family protein [Ramlibacter sp.]